MKWGDTMSITSPNLAVGQSVSHPEMGVGVFLGFAAPGIPRGGFIMLTPLFLAIGLPAEGIGILIAVDAIPDTFATVLNTTGDLTAATLVASFRETDTAVITGRSRTHDRQNPELIRERSLGHE